MKKTLIFLLLTGINIGFGQEDSNQLSTKFENLIVKSIVEGLPLYVYIDSTHFLLGDVEYDDDLNVLNGRLLRTKRSKMEFPYAFLKLKDYSTLNNNLDQIRLLDITEAAIKRPPVIKEKGKEPCADQMILQNGDTVDCRIVDVSDDYIQYKKCKYKIKRTFGKYKKKIVKIIFHNGSEYEFATLPDHKKADKKKRTLAIVGPVLAVGVMISLAVLFVF